MKVKKLTGPILYLGSPEREPDIRHATGFLAPDPLVLLVKGSRRWLVVSRLEYGRARARVPSATVYTPEMLGLQGGALRELGQWALALLRRKRLCSVRVAKNFPLASGLLLQQSGIALSVENAQDLRPERLIKTPAEIACIRDVQRATVRAMRRARQMIAESSVDARGRLVHSSRLLTSERVRDLLRRTVLEHGCIDRGTIVAGGAQGADPHEAGSGPLRAGEFVVIDLFPRHLETGYWGDLTRTYLRGEPSPRQLALYAAVRKAQQEALGMIREGVNGKDVHERADCVMREAGFETGLRDGLPVGFIHGTGHGVGLEIHEGPSLSSTDALLRSGMVVTVEPGLYYPELGGVRIEDTVVVTPKGFEHLARCPIPAGASLAGIA